MAPKVKKKDAMFYSRQKQLAFDKVELEYQKIMMVQSAN